MNSRTALNIGLLSAVALAGAALYFKPEHHAEETFALVSLPLEQLQRIEIRRERHVPIVLQRSERQPWTMVLPVKARLDDIGLGRVLDVARLHAAARLPVANAERFELDKPWAQIRFNDQTVEFGMTNAVTQELYIRSGDHIYAVNPRLAAAVPSDAAKLLAHRLFAADEVAVGFELSGFAMRHDGVRWHMHPEDPGLSQDDLVRWADQWRLASSIITQPATGGRIDAQIKVMLRDGSSIVLSVMARTPDLVLRREDEGLDYHFPARLAAELLASPSVAASKQP